MYAIVDIAGQQFKVEKDQQLLVHRLEGAEGSAVIFDNVLLIDDAGKIAVGQPKITGAGVAATIIEHLKGKKVLVYHKKRRKGYEKMNGHRQALSKILIQGISNDIEKLKKDAESFVVTTKTEKAPVKKVAAKKVSASKATKEEKTEKAPAKKVVKASAPKKTAIKKAKKAE